MDLSSSSWKDPGIETSGTLNLASSANHPPPMRTTSTSIAANEDLAAAGDFEQHFPAKLHYLMELLEADGQSHVCGFQPHGKAFLVPDRDTFVELILPKWFQQHRWASFQRQLNHYEFKRISTGRDKGAYYHPSFVKGRRGLCRYIKRVKVKGSGPRKPSCPETEPNFYDGFVSAPKVLSWHPPLPLRRLVAAPLGPPAPLGYPVDLLGLWMPALPSTSAPQGSIFPILHRHPAIGACAAAHLHTSYQSHLPAAHGPGLSSNRPHPEGPSRAQYQCGGSVTGV